tara:strand:+ start:22 stop:501 length:480 start_codon:yes stop_codon:yes gene_type:complete
MNVEETIKKLYAKHNTWVDIVSSFGCNKVTSEDLVSEMYIKIQLKIEKGLDINFIDDEINYYYIFKTLRTLFIDLKRKEKNIKFQEIDDCDFISHDAPYDSTYSDIQYELDKQYWYDKKIFEIINEGMSIASLSRKTGIRYYSLYNTYTKVKEKLKKLL